MRLSVLIPVFNEEATIREVISRVQATGLADEIVVVDDGSSDRSREILAEYDGKDGVRVIHDQRLVRKPADRHGDLLQSLPLRSGPRNPTSGEPIRFRA